MVREQDLELLSDSAANLDDEDEEMLAGLDLGIKDADEGRLMPMDEVRRMVQQWSTKSTLREKL